MEKTLIMIIIIVILGLLVYFYYYISDTIIKILKSINYILDVLKELNKK